MRIKESINQSPHMAEQYVAFLSHSSKDSELVNNVYERLKQTSYKPWKSPQDILLGKPYAQSIIEGIKECHFFLIFISSASMASEDVLSELEIAHRYRKIILPIFIEDVQLNNELQYYLSRKQWINAYNKDVDWYSMVVDAMTDHLGGNTSIKQKEQANLCIYEWSEILQFRNSFDGEELDILFEKAYSLWTSGEHSQAFQKFAYLTLHNFSKSFGYLGLCYEFGEGVERDVKKMIACYNMAIERKEYLGVYRLGMYLSSIAKYDEALSLYMSCINDGWATADAYYKVGLLYEEGNGVKRNLSTAVEYFRQAYAKNKSHEAKEKLESYGELNIPDDFQIEIPKNVSKLSSKKLYDLALSSREDNVSLSYNYFLLAAEKGHSLAARSALNIVEENMLDIPDELRESLIGAVNNMESFVRTNPSYAFFAGLFYEHPDDFVCYSDREKAEMAEKMYRIGSEAGYKDCMWKLGEILYAREDYQGAFELFLNSAKLDQGTSMFKLAYMYENGIGVEQNLNEAINWYQKCTKTKCCWASDAKKHLRSLE